VKLRKTDRQQKILDEFRISPSVRLGDLAERYGVTKETIRRDIDELSEQGLLARTYGGAVASSMNYEPGLRERTSVNPEGRRRMARVAAGLIADCAIVMIDTGATMSSICEQLAASVPKSGDIELTAITNSLRNAAMLGANPSIRVILCPGNYDDRENAAFGPQTVEFLGRYSVDAVIMSAGGISGENVTDANSEAVAVKRAMLRQANRSILVMDRRKFNFPQFERVCDLGEIDELVTDEPLGPEAATVLAKTRVHVAAAVRERAEARR
jgi:DeoR/GlpR family transcriptional regulator of sugar metabolism